MAKVGEHRELLNRAVLTKLPLKRYGQNNFDESV